MNEIRHIDLCSGIGGFALAAGWAGAATGRDVRTVAFSEIDPFCQAVLRHHWPGVPVIPDLRQFDYEGGCDLLTAGYPCQPFSVAGQQKGAADDRHLWPDVFEIVKRKRPAWCLFENVSGHITLGLDQVLVDLENEGYAARPLVIPACAVDAPHRRDRVWIVGHSNGNSSSFRGHDQTNASQGSERRNNPRRSRKDDWGQSGTEADGIIAHANRNSQPDGSLHAISRQRELVGHAAREQLERRVDNGGTPGRGPHGQSARSNKDVADTDTTRREGRIPRGANPKREDQSGHLGCDGAAYGQSGENWWTVEPDVGRVAHGIPNRVAQLRALGNAIVPQIAAEIMEAMFRNWEGASK